MLQLNQTRKCGKCVYVVVLLLLSCWVNCLCFLMAVRKVKTIILKRKVLASHLYIHLGHDKKKIMKSAQRIPARCVDGSRLKPEALLAVSDIIGWRERAGAVGRKLSAECLLHVHGRVSVSTPPPASQKAMAGAAEKVVTSSLVIKCEEQERG